MAWGWWTPALAVLVVGLGGAVGAVVRHLLTTSSLGGLRGVLVANTAGAGLLGAVVALVDRPALALFLGTGLCGALTTWSTLALQAVELAARGPWRAGAFVVLNVALGLGAALLALLLLG